MTTTLISPFEELIKLAQEDPRQLEQLRQTACEAVIASAPLHRQRKLKGLQFKIDMECQRGSSKRMTCARLADKMQLSFNTLRQVLANTKAQLPHHSETECPTHLPSEKTPTVTQSNILPFPSQHF